MAAQHQPKASLMVVVAAAALALAACGGAAAGGAASGSIQPSPSATSAHVPTPTPTTQPTASPTPVYQDAFSLTTGTCFDPIEDMDDESLLAARLVSCAEPHLMEVFGVPSLGVADAPFPGEEALVRNAELVCDAAFERYVGVEFERSVLEYIYYTPAESTWVAGDRTALCAVVAHEAQPFTASVNGSKR